MARNLKYIRIKSCFLIFAEPLKHSELKVNEPVISAGFCYQDDEDWVCYGESISLGVKALPEDSKFLTNQFNGNWG